MASGMIWRPLHQRIGSAGSALTRRSLRLAHRVWPWRTWFGGLRCPALGGNDTALATWATSEAGRRCPPISLGRALFPFKATTHIGLHYKFPGKPSSRPLRSRPVRSHFGTLRWAQRGEMDESRNVDGVTFGSSGHSACLAGNRIVRGGRPLRRGGVRSRVGIAVRADVLARHDTQRGCLDLRCGALAAVAEGSRPLVCAVRMPARARTTRHPSFRALSKMLGLPPKHAAARLRAARLSDRSVCVHAPLEKSGRTLAVRSIFPRALRIPLPRHA
jgi:hypothetical protein